jgi:hypothetical protein
MTMAMMDFQIQGLSSPGRRETGGNGFVAIFSSVNGLW